MPALVDNLLDFADFENTTILLKDNSDDSGKDGDNLKSTLCTIETVTITTEPEESRSGGRGCETNTVEEEGNENDTVSETSREDPEFPGEDIERVASSEDDEKTTTPSNELTTTKPDNDDSDSDVSSMTTATLPTSSGEEEDLKPPPPSPVRDVMAVTIKFGDRDVLDLATTLTSKSWSLRPAVLPPMNLNMFWANRAQYHRLGNYGTEENNMVGCRYCGFQFILPK